MSGTARYTDVFAHPHHDEFERLMNLAAVLDESTFRVLEALRPQPGWRCLEIGAGAGTVATWLADRCPDGQVVATDVTSRYLEGIVKDNVVAVRHDVTEDDFPECSFDFIFARWVFTHLPERARILERVASWLTPGGCLMLGELAFFPVSSSPHPGYAKIMNACLQITRQAFGLDGDWARTFPKPLAILGLEQLGLAADLPIIAPGNAAARFAELTFQRLRQPIVDSGLATAQEVEQVITDLHSDEFFDFLPALVTAWGRRPHDGSRSL